MEAAIMRNSYFIRCLFALVAGPIVCLITAVQTYSQVDSALGFLPLKPGNIWEYKNYRTQNGINSVFLGYTDNWTTADTILGNQHYQILNIGRYPNLVQSRKFLRVDSISSVVYQLSQPLDSLRASVGDYHYSFCYLNTDVTIFGVPTKVKGFSHQGESGDGAEYAYGFGVVGKGSWWPTSGAVVGTGDSLIYARIDGKEYGTYLSVSDPPKVTPTAYSLAQNYPNPFNPSTTVRYGLPNRSHLILTVFNTLGQQVAVLQDEEQEAGYYEVKFDGSGLSSGVYFYTMEAGSFVETRKLLLIR
jgi:hypothetical protein